MSEDEILERDVLSAFYDVYNTLGYGFLEQVYVAALERELCRRGHRVQREVWVDVYFKGEIVSRQRLDMIVDETLVLEVKSTERLSPNATRQLYNYLRATDLGRGLVLHFGPQPRFYRVRCTHERDARP